MSAIAQGTEATAVREAVSAAYAQRVSEDRKCCGGSEGAACGVGPQALGYTEEDVQRVPEGAAAPSYGCGNPLAFSGVQEGDTVVDLGSGAGFDLLIAAERVGPTGRVIGVDMTDAMIERARQNVATAGHTNVEVRKGLIEELPVESGAVDWIISNCVINLSPEKHRVFAEIARVLKPGGRMLISDIVADDLPAAVRNSLAALSGCVGGAISEAEYVAGLRAAGLVDVEVRQRTRYTCAELIGLAESLELTDASLGVEGIEGGLSQLAEGLDGKVASIAVHARKP